MTIWPRHEPSWARHRGTTRCRSGRGSSDPGNAGVVAPFGFGGVNGGAGGVAASNGHACVGRRSGTDVCRGRAATVSTVAVSIGEARHTSTSAPLGSGGVDGPAGAVVGPRSHAASGRIASVYARAFVLSVARSGTVAGRAVHVLAGVCVTSALAGDRVFRAARGSISVGVCSRIARI